MNAKLVLTICATTMILGCAKEVKEAEEAKPAEEKAATPASTSYPGDAVSVEPTAMASGLKYVDYVVGSGATAETGKAVVVHYTGYLTNGFKFDSSLDRDQAIQFQLGAGEMIKGWDIGIVGMRVGGKRKLIIPPAMGYGGSDYGPIPGNSVLVFDIELLEVK